MPCSCQFSFQFDSVLFLVEEFAEVIPCELQSSIVHAWWIVKDSQAKC